MTSKARGMPSMELKEETKQEMIEEENEEKPLPEKEMFERPSMEIKPVEVLEDWTPKDAPQPIEEVPDENVNPNALKPVEIKKKAIKKPKKKLTEKQLDALRLGREKSIKTRQAKAKAKKEAKEQPSSNQHAPSNPIQIEQRQQQPVVNFQPQSIDYDKIINGVASKYDTMMKNREEREHRVAKDINLFEERIRSEERNRVLDEIDILQKEEEHKKDEEIAYSVVSKTRPIQNQNPYLFAMEIGARKKFQRY